MRNFKTRNEAVKNEFLALCKNLFRTFPSLPEELAVSCNFTMTTLLQWVRPIRDSTSHSQPLSSNRSNTGFQQLLDDRHEAKTHLEKLIIIDNNSMQNHVQLSVAKELCLRTPLCPCLQKSTLKH